MVKLKDKNGKIVYLKEDLSGNYYEELKVLNFEELINHRSYWKCKCSCGKEIIVSSDNLKSGNTTSCGCKRSKSNIKNIPYGTVFDNLKVIKFDSIKKNKSGKGIAYYECECLICKSHVIVPGYKLRNGSAKSCPTCARIKDLREQRFGRLKVVKFAGIKNNVAFWECECDCGNHIVVRGRSLTTGNTRSCGCLNDEARRSRAVHGMWDSRMYGIWKSMKQRCTNPNDGDYQNYGGRGIKLCKEWYNFQNFYNDMKDGYRDDLTINRIDNDGDYCKENCNWISNKEQQNNKSTNVYVEYYDGIKLTIAQAAERYGKVNGGMTAARLRNGWSLNEALNIPDLNEGIHKKRYLEENKLIIKPIVFQPIFFDESLKKKGENKEE